MTNSIIYLVIRASLQVQHFSTMLGLDSSLDFTFVDHYAIDLLNLYYYKFSLFYLVLLLTNCLVGLVHSSPTAREESSFPGLEKVLLSFPLGIS